MRDLNQIVLETKNYFYETETKSNFQIGYQNIGIKSNLSAFTLDTEMVAKTQLYAITRVSENKTFILVLSGIRMVSHVFNQLFIIILYAPTIALFFFPKLSVIMKNGKIWDSFD